MDHSEASISGLIGSIHICKQSKKFATSSICAVPVPWHNFLLAAFEEISALLLGCVFGSFMAAWNPHFLSTPPPATLSIYQKVFWHMNLISLWQYLSSDLQALPPGHSLAQGTFVCQFKIPFMQMYPNLLYCNLAWVQGAVNYLHSSVCERWLSFPAVCVRWLPMSQQGNLKPADVFLHSLQPWSLLQY